MTDVFSCKKRSWIMSRIRGRDTGPELVVRSQIHRMGYRFRLCCRDLPGCPDIVLPRHRKVVFVHGCFWHGHTGLLTGYEASVQSGFLEKETVLKHHARPKTYDRNQEAWLAGACCMGVRGQTNECSQA